MGTAHLISPSLPSGGSHSDIVILTAKGEVVGQADGPGTNPWVFIYERASALQPPPILTLITPNWKELRR